MSIPLSPGAIIQKSTDANTQNCKKDPSLCLWQCCVDAVIFAGMFTAMSLLIDHKAPGVDNVVTFMTAWIPVLFILKIMDLEYADQLARVAGWSLGSKIFSALL